MFKVTQAQLDKHNELNARFKTEITFPEGYEVVPEDEAKSISATYGTIFIQIAPDGSSAS